MPESIGDYLTVTDVARELGVSRQTVYTMLRRGELARVLKLGNWYIPRHQVNAARELVARHKAESQGRAS